MGVDQKHGAQMDEVIVIYLRQNPETGTVSTGALGMIFLPLFNFCRLSPNVSHVKSTSWAG